MLKNILFVALGGSAGAVARYCVYFLMRSTSFPLATFFINIVGSLLLGIVMAYGINDSQHSPAKLILATGFCGGFTTFSAFAFENFRLLQAGKYETAFFYILLSVALSVLATWAGFKLVH